MFISKYFSMFLFLLFSNFEASAGEVVFFKKTYTDPDGEMDGYFSKIKYGASYLRPVVYISNGEYMDPYSNPKAFTNMSNFAASHGFELEEVKSVGGGERCLTSNDFVFSFGEEVCFNFYDAKVGEGSLYENEEYHLFVERNYNILSNKKIKKVAASVVFDYESVGKNIMKDLNLASYKHKTRIQLHEAYDFLVGSYLKYVVNKNGNFVARQGIFYSQNNRFFVLSDDEQYSYDILYVGDLDKDNNPDFIYEISSLKPGSKKSKFVITERKNDEWIIEKIIGPFKCLEAF